MLTYFGVALNESSGRVKYDFLERMMAPCGPPPPVGKYSHELCLSDFTPIQKKMKTKCTIQICSIKHISNLFTIFFYIIQTITKP